MALPSDFDKSLWFSPLTFQGILGRSMARGIYSELFGPDGFAKPKAELLADDRLQNVLPNQDEIDRDAKFVAFLVARDAAKTPPQAPPAHR